MIQLAILNAAPTVLVLSFAALVCFTSLIQLVSDRRASARRRRDEEMDVLIHRIDAQLTETRTLLKHILSSRTREGPR